MKAVILAGGLGTRISEETYLKPKPMIEIGGKPILWHIMEIYSAHGVHDFVIPSRPMGHASHCNGYGAGDRIALRTSYNYHLDGSNNIPHNLTMLCQ